MSDASVYDEFAPLLIRNGYFPLPIIPGQKRPGVYTPSNGEFTGLVGWEKRPRPIITPQPTAGIGVRCGECTPGVFLVALDYDDDEAALRVSEVMPESHVNKTGKRGWTPFYRSSRSIPSENFVNEDGELMLQVLGEEKQTVVAPTIHPDTGRPYRWTNGASLYDTPLDQLPELPEDYRERIMALGYKSGGKKKENGAACADPQHGGGTSEDYQGTPCGQINDLAMKRLADWIPNLGLYNLKRERGPANWTAVATWRPSHEGRPNEERERNLKIGSKGIVDFGDGGPDGKGYSPIDLVVATRRCDVSAAFEWLDERLEWSKRGPEVDFDAIASSGVGEEPRNEETPKEDSVGRKPVLPKSLGSAWHFGDPAPAPLPMLVPNLIPRKGFGYIGGQWGTFKTFVTNDLAVAVASEGKFAGQQVTVRGAVVQIELEGSQSEVRVNAAAAAREVSSEKLPIVHLNVTPPTIMINGKPNSAWRGWSNDLAKYAREFAAYHGLPLALITLDPQNRIAGFKDEQSSSEGQVVANALSGLSGAADCFVLVVDHLGKDASAGLRGTSAKETNPLVILSTGETKKDVYQKRELEVRKMRNGRAGLAVGFRMEDYEVTIQQIVSTEGGAETIEPYVGKTLVVQWEDELRPVGEDRADGPVSKQQRRALAVLGEMIATSGEPLPKECSAPAGLKGVKLEIWRIRLIDKTVIEGKNKSAAFSQLKNTLLDRKEIDISHGLVWVPLP